ncbi:TPA: helix-turn-helix transcriptional regulator [Clostridioides difficile]|uniref:helix-turn-helix domain-containing protein n=2 Tax=Clostridioides TaxID=1870884 RepID=UPI00038CAFBA|nr:helix-turn-helix transcriptional regulator [Clostridioides difficile]EGT3815695.1 XRE family transcriptional regulator [Clostridioides difficile]EGT3826884.1 XRE family transcriptional regulator [Clostridioides difficile]EGT4251218.1 XRE family transcriptional regulator [Clostridioides difficile]EGT4637245.1 XRE family transcriptional regulator [Clostridioides difficile]EGT4710192.1 XRE family transcriptional regulator [Clostridioides difficile]
MSYRLNIKVLDLAMLKKGYSLNQLSKECGLSKSTISRAINRKSIPRRLSLYEISKALDIPVEELIKEEYE